MCSRFCAAIALAAFWTAGVRCDEPVIRAADLRGLSVNATTTYEGKALYGYIDGGADLYREYGFIRLTVQSLVLGGEEFSAEIYRMSDDTSAFGIFSVSTSGGDTSLGPHSSVSAYQTLCASGPFVVRVVNYTGTLQAKESAAEIAAVIRRRAGAGAFPLPDLLQKIPGGIGTVRYVRGPLGIQNGYPGWGESLDGLEPYSGYLVASGDESVRVALLRFAAPVNADEYLRRLPPGTAVRRDSPHQVLTVEGPEDLRRALLGPP